MYGWLYAQIIRFVKISHTLLHTCKPYIWPWGSESSGRTGFITFLAVVIKHPRGKQLRKRGLAWLWLTIPGHHPSRWRAVKVTSLPTPGNSSLLGLSSLSPFYSTLDTILGNAATSIASSLTSINLLKIIAHRSAQMPISLRILHPIKQTTDLNHHKT